MWLSSSGFAAADDQSRPERYESSWVQGSAAVVIDGDLSDWAGYKLPEVSLNYSKPALLPAGDADVGKFAATLRCFADSAYVYVGVAVNDSRPVFGRQPFNNSWRDDSVLISFYGNVSLRHLVNKKFHGTDGQILISADTKGRTIVEGAAPIGDRKVSSRLLQLPYLWRALGVRAALKPRTGGYVVEVAIPFELMQWAPGNPALPLGMNVRVFDSVGGNSYKQSLAWAVDPYDTSPLSSEFYNQVLFTELAPPGQGQVAGEDVGLHRATVLAAMTRMAEGRADTAVPMLMSVPGEFWVLPLLAAAQQGAGEWDASNSTLQQVIDKGPDESVAVWARERLATSYLRKGDVQAARSQYQQLASLSQAGVAEIGVVGMAECERQTQGEEAAIAIYHNALARMPAPSAKLLSELGDLLVQVGRRRDALLTYQRIADAPQATAKEKGWASWQVQKIQYGNGELEASIEAGLHIQRTADDGDPSRRASVELLVRAERERDTASGAPSAERPTLYEKLLGGKATSFTALRMIELGEFSRTEGKPEAAVEAFNQAAAMDIAPRADRALAVLRAQEILADDGKTDLALAAGVKLQGTFEEELETRLSGLTLLRDLMPPARADGMTYNSLATRLAEDLLRSWRDGDREESARAFHLLKRLKTGGASQAPTVAEQGVSAPR
jgi:tetratricopeptide (TPR) repeat protein